jgi:hypothetical protein
MTLLLTDRKDEPPRETPISPSVPTPAVQVSPTAAEYRALLVKHRHTQLLDTHKNIKRLQQTYDRAAEAILARVRALPDTVDRNGLGWLRAQLNIMRGIREELDRFRKDYAGLLDLSMISSAQAAADREAEVARLVGAPSDPRLYVTADRAITLSTGEGIAVQFGALARDAVVEVANRYYRDGIQLSQRLHNLSQMTREVVEDTIVRAIADGTSARGLAIELQRVMSAEGKATPRHHAMRIARTEINNSFREAHTKSVIDPATGGTKSYIVGVKWNLSLSHARSGPDICDIWAAHDEGLGVGVYSPDSVPVDHPHGLCFQTSVLKAFPDVIPSTMTMQPQVDKVPESHVRYYAERLNDPVAIARLAQVGI